MRPADAHGFRAQRDGFEDVRPTANATVKQHRDSSADRLDHARQRVK
jgi:hypothetical protein